MSRAATHSTALSAPDMTLIMLTLALLLIGLVASTSASIEYAEWHFQNPWFHSRRHFVYLLIGVVAAVASYCVEV